MFGGCGPYKKFSEVRVIGHYTCDQMRAAACGIAMCKSTDVPDKIREEAIAAHDARVSRSSKKVKHESGVRRAIDIESEERAVEHTGGAAGSPDIRMMMAVPSAECDNAIFDFIVGSCLPFHAANKDAFKNMVRILKRQPPNYKPPDAAALSGRLLGLWFACWLVQYYTYASYIYIMHTKPKSREKPPLPSTCVSNRAALVT